MPLSTNYYHKQQFLNRFFSKFIPKTQEVKETPLSKKERYRMTTRLFRLRIKNHLGKKVLAGKIGT